MCVIVSAVSRSGESDVFAAAREPSRDPVEVLVGEHPLRERREADAADAELAERVEQVRLDPAVEERVRRLVDQERRAELAQDRRRLARSSPREYDEMPA